jgi:DNA modification methylase
VNGATWEIRTGDCRAVLRELEAGSAQTVITSPPYFALRDYKAPDQIGLEPTPDEFVASIVAVFDEVWRVLRDDGTVWLNLGDTYNAYNGNRGEGRQLNGYADSQRNRPAPKSGLTVPTLKQKDLIGVPWMVAFALRAAGWYLRQEIIWHKPNPMPERVEDRPTRAHEQVFLLSKRPRYFYDAKAIRETAVAPFEDQVSWDERKAAGATWGNVENGASGGGTQRVVHGRGVSHALGDGKSRNKRSVWTVSTVGFTPPRGFEDDDHFATFPPKLIVPCVLAGAPEGGVVLDPFAGAATTGIVALRLGRSFVGIEANPRYAEMARARVRDDAPMFNPGAELVA